MPEARSVSYDDIITRPVIDYEGDERPDLNEELLAMLTPTSFLIIHGAAFSVSVSSAVIEAGSIGPSADASGILCG